MEDKTLEALFEEKVPTEELLKEAQVASRIRQVVVSLGTIALVGLLVWLTHLQLTPHIAARQSTEKYFYEKVRGANRFEMPFKKEISFFSGKAEAAQYKILGDTPVMIGKVTSGQDQATYSLPMADGGVYSETGYKQMLFYRPEVDRGQVQREVSRLQNMEGVRLAEVAISLQMPMSRYELEGLLPEGVTLNWAWLDTGVEGTEQVSEAQAIGYPMIDNLGKKLENPEGEWIKFLDIVKDKKTKQQMLYTVLYEEALRGQQILGGVVVGAPDALEQLGAVGQIRGIVVGETLTY
ncbi:MAG: anti sigma factor C-terminal domain-containing protein [Cellulosilyticaceae bacterium]